MPKLVKTKNFFTARFARGTEDTEESQQALTGYGETAISGHLHPCGIQVLATPREASVCVQNRISTVPDTRLSLLLGAILCELCASSPACGTGGRTVICHLPSPVAGYKRLDRAIHRVRLFDHEKMTRIRDADEL